MKKIFEKIGLTSTLIVLMLLFSSAYFSAIFLKDSDGNSFGVKQTGGKIRVINSPYGYAVAEGELAGHDYTRVFGYVSDVDNVYIDVWEGGASYVPPTTPIQMRIVSSSANDDGSPAGTGAQTVDIHYLDDTYTEQHERLTLNGVTPVNTVATNIIRVNDLHVMTAGSGGVAAGNISLQNIAGTVTYKYIPAGINQDRTSFYTVPAGKIFYLTTWRIGTGSGAGSHMVQFLLRATITKGTRNCNNI